MAGSRADRTAGVVWEHRWQGHAVHIGRYAPGQVMRPHAHPYAAISLVLAGALTEEADHREVVADVGSVVTKPAGTVHGNRIGPEGALMLSIALPDTPADPGTPLTTWRWSKDVRLASAVLRSLRIAAAGNAQDAEASDAIVLDVLSAASSATPRAERARTPSWLRDVRRALWRSARQPSRVTQLAAEANVHPVYLTRRFREQYGCSIREYQRAARVAAATELVVATERPLADVALTAGFSDQSHLSSALRAAAGISPGRLRRVATGPTVVDAG